MAGNNVVRTLEARVQAGNIGVFEGQMARATSAVTSFRGAVGLAGGAVAAFSAAVTGAALSAASKFQQAMVELEKVTDESTMEAMNGEILKMADRIPLAQSELADLAAQAGRFGIRGTENIRNFTEATAKMAFATDMTADKAGENFARLATLTQMPISEVKNLGATINSLSNNFATSSSEIVDSALRSASSLRQLGLSKQQIYGMSAAINQASESSERAGTRMRRLAQNILSPSSRAWDNLIPAMQMTKEEFIALRKENPIGMMKRMAAIMAEDDKQARQLRQGLSSVSEQALAALGSKWSEVERANRLANKEWAKATSLQHEFTAQTDTFQTQLDLVVNKLRGFAIVIGQRLLPGATDFLRRVNDLVGGLAKWNRKTEGAAALQGLFALQIGGVITALTALNPALGVAATAVTAFAFAVREDFGGIGTQARRVAGVLQTEVVATFRTLRQVAQPATTWLRSAWSSTATSVENSTSQLSKAIGDRLVTSIRTAGNTTRRTLVRMRSLWETHRADVLAAVRPLRNRVQAIVNQTVTRATAVVQQGRQRIEAEWRKHSGKVRGIVRRAMDWVLTDVDEKLALLASVTVPVPLGSIYKSFKNNFREIKRTVRTSLTETAAVARTGMQSVKRQILQPAQNTESEFRRNLGQIVTETRQTFAVIEDIITRVLGVVLRQVRPHLREMSALYQTHLSGPDGILANARTAFNALWSNVIKPILDIIQAGWRMFGDDIIRIFDGTLGTLLTAAEIGMDAILTAVNVVLNLMSGDFEGALNAIEGFVTRTFNRIGRWLRTDAKKILVGAVGILIDAIKWPFEQFYNWIIGNSLFKDIFRDIANYIAGGAKRGVTGALDTFARGVKDVFRGLASAIVGGPGAIINSLVSDIKGAIRDAVSWVKRTFNNAIPNSVTIDAGFNLPRKTIPNPLGKDYQIGGGHYGVHESLQMPRLDTGGYIDETGVAVVHEGEYIQPAKATPPRGRGGGGGPTIKELHVHANSRREGREAMDGVTSWMRAHNMN